MRVIGFVALPLREPVVAEIDVSARTADIRSGLVPAGADTELILPDPAVGSPGLAMLPPSEGWQLPIHGVSGDVVPEVDAAVAEFRRRAPGVVDPQVLAEQIWERPSFGGLPLRVLHAARRLGFGLENVLSTRFLSAVKTGTSKDMRDNWCIGYTDRYTVGVWVGNASGAPMHDVSGISGAAPVWQALVDHLHQGWPSKAPRPPPGVQRRRVDLAAAGEPPRQEFFLQTGPTEPSLASRSADRGRDTASRQPIGIRSPVDGSIFAIDPDVPGHAQRIALEGEHGTWVLNGQRIGTGTALRWSPRPGRHELQLLDARGHVVQRVRFEVRGLPRSPTAAEARRGDRG
jgi:penicillin-binding protein 1C